jgi:hypothetical protein
MKTVANYDKKDKTANLQTAGINIMLKTRENFLCASSIKIRSYPLKAVVILDKF